MQDAKIPYEKLVEWRATLITIATLTEHEKEGALLLHVHNQMGEYKPEPCACTIKPLSEIISKPEPENITAAKELLDKAIEEHNETHAETHTKTHEETHACDIDDTLVEPVTVNSKNSRAWTDDEISVIRTAATVEKAISYYRCHGGKRNQNGIEQKWQKLRKEGKLILKGHKVRLNNPGSIYHDKIGTVRAITDSKLSATVEYEGNVQVQYGLQYLEVIK